MNEPSKVPDDAPVGGQRILVTGAAGFIGFHTSKRLLAGRIDHPETYIHSDVIGIFNLLGPII